jgi:hypothetical protein
VVVVDFSCSNWPLLPYICNDCQRVSSRNFRWFTCQHQAPGKSGRQNGLQPAACIMVHVLRRYPSCEPTGCHRLRCSQRTRNYTCASTSSTLSPTQWEQAIGKDNTVIVSRSYAWEVGAIPQNFQDLPTRRNLPALGNRVSTLSVRDLQSAMLHFTSLPGLATRHGQIFQVSCV